MKINNSLFLIITLLLLSCADSKAKGQSNANAESFIIKPFEIDVFDSDYSMAYTIQTVITNSELKIVFYSGVVGEKDSVLFFFFFQPSGTLQQISNINLDSLKEYYSNTCISDGSQITVISKKNGREKSIRLCNYYHEDIGKAILLINSLVADKYQIWYDKKELMENYKICNGN